jgi:predicted permease
LTFYVFQPAFLCVSVGTTLAEQQSSISSSMPSLWIMPVVAIIQIGLNTLLAQIMTRGLTFRSEAEKRQVAMCTTFNNAGPLPLIFSQALLQGTSLQGPAAAAISFYLLSWSPLFWTVGKRILIPSSESSTNWKEQLGTLLSPPVLGSIAGMLIGGVPFLRNLFLGKGVAAPVTGALQTLGSAYLPAAILVLAGSLVAKKPTPGEDYEDASTSPSLRSLALIFATRFLISPLLAFGLCRLLSPWLGSVGTKGRAVLLFVLLMEGCTPPAQNSVILLQLYQKTGEAASMAKLLTILYAAAVIPMTILLSACLAMSGILQFS